MRFDSSITGRLLGLSLLLCLGLFRAQGQGTFSKFYNLVSPGIVGFTDIIKLDSSYILLGGSYDTTFWRVINLVMVDHQVNEIKRKVLKNDTLNIATERQSV